MHTKQITVETEIYSFSFGITNNVYNKKFSAHGKFEKENTINK